MCVEKKHLKFFNPQLKALDFGHVTVFFFFFLFFFIIRLWSVGSRCTAAYKAYCATLNPLPLVQTFLLPPSCASTSIRREGS
jgi:hypothetical protein